MDSEEKNLDMADPYTDPEPQKPVVQVRKAKKRKSSRAKREYEVQVIPATKGVTPIGEVAPAKRVAAYCRVSTDQEAQSSSYELQVQHYTIDSQRTFSRKRQKIAHYYHHPGKERADKAQIYLHFTSPVFLLYHKERYI